MTGFPRTWPASFSASPATRWPIGGRTPPAPRPVVVAAVPVPPRPAPVPAPTPAPAKTLLEDAGGVPPEEVEAELDEEVARGEIEVAA